MFSRFHDCAQTKLLKKHGRLIRHATATVANNDGTGRDLAKLVSRFTAFFSTNLLFSSFNIPFLATTARFLS